MHGHAMMGKAGRVWQADIEGRARQGLAGKDWPGRQGKNRRVRKGHERSGCVR